RLDRIGPVCKNLGGRTGSAEHDTRIRGRGVQCHCHPFARMKSNSPASDRCFQRPLGRRRYIPQHPTDFCKCPLASRSYFRPDFTSNHSLLRIVAPPKYVPALVRPSPLLLLATPLPQCGRGAVGPIQLEANLSSSPAPRRTAAEGESSA